MKKVLLITPIFLLLLSCSQYEDTAFKIGWMLDCPDEDKELCECEVDKLLETMANAEEKLAIIELHYGNNKAEKAVL